MIYLYVFVSFVKSFYKRFALTQRRFLHSVLKRDRFMIMQMRWNLETTFVSFFNY